MEERILEKVEELSDEMIKTIIEMVKIDSVEAEAEPDAPFGRGVKTALDAALLLADRMGFQTVNVDNYMGYASYGEEGGDGYICAVGHLDVVPEGEGWTHPPYGGEEENGRIYGRGAIDDKGPLIAAMYALKAVRESGRFFPVCMPFTPSRSWGFP